jgi:hypothetical protein
MLPEWMQWIQAIAVLVIAGVGVRIAYKQARIAEGKLNLDLFDKRFAVFDAARDMIGKFLREGHIDTQDILIFSANVADAAFLFEWEVEEYLTELRKKAAAAHAKTEQLKAMRDNDKRRDKLIDDIAEIELALGTEHERLVKVFKPYLQLGNI